MSKYIRIVKAESKTILYIDDDPDDREILISAVTESNSGYKVVEAENGLKGLDYLNRVKQDGGLPCLIILDLNMPVLDGRQTLHRIRQDSSFQKVPVVLYTSSNNPNDKSFFHEQGVVFITIYMITFHPQDFLAFCRKHTM
jgi:CheY-like chemotaxis protein